MHLEDVKHCIQIIEELVRLRANLDRYYEFVKHFAVADKIEEMRDVLDKEINSLMGVMQLLHNGGLGVE